MTTVIEIDDKGIFCYTKPLHIYSDSPDEKTSRMYQRALAEAKDDKIYFRDQLATAIKLIGYKGMLEIEFDKEYPVPDGYEVKIEDGEWSVKLPSGSFIQYDQYAILVPKQQSIEEAAETYSKFSSVKDVGQAFIAGAKSRDIEIEKLKEEIKSLNGRLEQFIHNTTDWS